MFNKPSKFPQADFTGGNPIAASFDYFTQQLKAPPLKILDNPQLVQALETAAACETLIKPEQERIQVLLDAATSEIEKEARQYQLWYVEHYLARAAAIARKRLEYFRTITDTDVELEKCANNKHHWFEYYAWGYDPRARTPLSVVPFEPFPKQNELIDWLDAQVFDRRASGLIEKSRDEGATEVSVRWGIHNWRFRTGFSMLLSTRTEDEVDTKKKQGTLFERARFQIKLLPFWMLPKGFDLDKDLLPDKLIANPVNGNALIGQAPVENMGRGDRVTCALFDEFAFWRFGGYPQYRSMSQTTDSIIMPSSVAGKLNQYADIAFDGLTAKFTMDWRDNPFKSSAWYNSLPYGYITPKMSQTTIAQEIDRNYDAAQPGKVFHYREEQIFIDRDEFLRPFEEAKLGNRFFDHDTQGRRTKFKIPDDWRFLRLSDYGQTEGHDWGYVLAAQPRKSYPLSDTWFVFIARNLEPTGLATAQAVQTWSEYESDVGLRDKMGKFKRLPQASYCSHEAKELRQVLLQKYGETWSAWKAEYDVGIETLNDWWTPEEIDKPNPYRPFLNGRCRLVFVAPNGEYQCVFNERLNEWFVTISQTEAGFFTARKQMSAYHYPITELGKAVKAMRPTKEFDDIIDPLKALGVMWNREPEGLTIPEQIEAALPQELRLANLLKGRKGLKDSEYLARDLAEEEVREQLNIRQRRPDWMDVDEDSFGESTDFDAY